MDHRPQQPYGMVAGLSRPRKSAVTLSGLLNVLDGVGSEEGKLFFATVRFYFIISFSPSVD